MSEQIVLRCEDSLEGIFTALFDAFVCKNKMKAPYTVFPLRPVKEK